MDYIQSFYNWFAAWHKPARSLWQGFAWYKPARSLWRGFQGRFITSPELELEPTTITPTINNIVFASQVKRNIETYFEMDNLLDWSIIDIKLTTEDYHNDCDYIHYVTHLYIASPLGNFNMSVDHNGFTLYFPSGLKVRSYKFQQYWHITQYIGNNFKYIYDITDLSMNLSNMCIYKLLNNYYDIILNISIWALLESEEGWTESEI